MAKSIISELRKNFVTLITAAFGLVAALQWNEAIKQWIAMYVPVGSGAMAATYSAVIVTVIAVVVIFIISKLGKK